MPCCGRPCAIRCSSRVRVYECESPLAVDHGGAASDSHDLVFMFLLAHVCSNAGFLPLGSLRKGSALCQVFPGGGADLSGRLLFLFTRAVASDASRRGSFVVNSNTRGKLGYSLPKQHVCFSSIGRLAGRPFQRVSCVPRPRCFVTTMIPQQPPRCRQHVLCSCGKEETAGPPIAATTVLPLWESDRPGHSAQ